MSQAEAGKPSQRQVRAEAIAQRLSAPRKAIMCQGVPPTRTHSASAAAADAFELKVSDDGASSSEESVDNDALVDLMFEQELFHLEVASEGEIPLPP